MGRRGPKRQEGRREANGRLSRKKVDVTRKLNGDLDRAEREALRVGVEARLALYGIAPGRLRDVRAECYVGRLAMAGTLTDRQFEAAAEYLRAYHAMTIAIGSRQPGAVNLNPTRGLPGPENIEESVHALAKWDAARKAIQARQNQIRGQGALIAALQYCVIEDRQLQHLVEWLRIALDALADHFQIGDKRKAA